MTWTRVTDKYGDSDYVCDDFRISWHYASGNSGARVWTVERNGKRILPETRTLRNAKAIAEMHLYVKETSTKRL